MLLKRKKVRKGWYTNSGSQPTINVGDSRLVSIVPIRRPRAAIPGEGAREQTMPALISKLAIVICGDEVTSNHSPNAKLSAVCPINSPKDRCHHRYKDPTHNRENCDTTTSPNSELRHTMTGFGTAPAAARVLQFSQCASSWPLVLSTQGTASQPFTTRFPANGKAPGS